MMSECLHIMCYILQCFYRIRTIEKLDELTKLDVLDLHGNKVAWYWYYIIDF